MSLSTRLRLTSRVCQRFSRPSLEALERLEMPTVLADPLAGAAIEGLLAGPRNTFPDSFVNPTLPARRASAPQEPGPKSPYPVDLYLASIPQIPHTSREEGPSRGESAPHAPHCF
jgi:hypothetical protein